MAIVSLTLTTLSTLSLFQGLMPEELARLIELLHLIIFPSGTNIIASGQPGSVAYLVLRGTLKVHVEQADGSDVILGIYGSGELLGEMSLLEGCECCATVITVDQSTLCWIDHDAFELCLRTMPVLSYNLARHLSRRLRSAAA